MAALILWPLLATLAQAGPAVYDVTASASASVNEGGSPGLKQAKLSDTRSIACYTDYSAGNGSARGKCSLMEVLGGSIAKLGDVVFEDAAVVAQSIEDAYGEPQPPPAFSRCLRGPCLQNPKGK